MVGNPANRVLYSTFLLARKSEVIQGRFLEVTRLQLVGSDCQAINRKIFQMYILTLRISVKKMFLEGHWFLSLMLIAILLRRSVIC